MSTQNTSTPEEFITAIQDYLRVQFMYDLAASSDNHKALWYFTEKDDSLNMDWPTDDWCWLNPTFCNLTKWVDKCAEQYKKGVRIVSIWPCSSDLNQISTFQNAMVYMIHGRIWKLVRGCMVCVWDESRISGVAGLRWDKKESNLTRIW
jgi:phage N-6-adenine-methyltransferase